MSLVTSEFTRINDLKTEGIEPSQEQAKIRRDALVTDVRDRVIEALLRKNFDQWINLENTPQATQNTTPFITRVGLDQSVPLHGTGTAELIRFLKGGILDFRYFNPDENGIFPPRPNPHDLPTNSRVPSLIVVEGIISKAKVADGMVLGPSPFVHRLERPHAFAIEDITRIGICQPKNGAHSRRVIEEIRSALGL